MSGKIKVKNVKREGEEIMYGGGMTKHVWAHGKRERFL
jgi:hypothetical protein